MDLETLRGVFAVVRDITVSGGLAFMLWSSYKGAWEWTRYRIEDRADALAREKILRDDCEIRVRAEQKRADEWKAFAIEAREELERLVDIRRR